MLKEWDVYLFTYLISSLRISVCPSVC